MTIEYGRILRTLEKGVEFMDSSLNFVLKDQCNPLTSLPGTQLLLQRAAIVLPGPFIHSNIKRVKSNHWNPST